ncbi:MAG TPA: lysophospholipid acyltransferase family protein [Gemmatimonadaceae bacterium]|nr:lysophospholipid acyltransferase family protein [Gemmatimonadaceae bacterium]
MNANVDGPTANHHADWRVRIFLPIGIVLLSILAKTWRITERNGTGWRRLGADRKGWILSLWHGTLLFLAFRHRCQGMVVLVSEHRDGELIARVLHVWGYRTVRGSSTRGGGRALRAMIRELNQGSAVAVTPDGPRGPAQRYQPGALMAAHHANSPVVAVGIHVDRAWRLKSWDRQVIPKPFARIVVAYEDPLMTAGASAREAADDVARFEAAMRAAQQRADA